MRKSVGVGLPEQKTAEPSEKKDPKETERKIDQLVGTIADKLYELGYSYTSIKIYALRGVHREEYAKDLLLPDLPEELEEELKLLVECLNEVGVYSVLGRSGTKEHLNLYTGEEAKKYEKWMASVPHQVGEIEDALSSHYMRAKAEEDLKTLGDELPSGLPVVEDLEGQITAKWGPDARTYAKTPEIIKLEDQIHWAFIVMKAEVPAMEGKIQRFEELKRIMLPKDVPKEEKEKVAEEYNELREGFMQIRSIFGGLGKRINQLAALEKKEGQPFSSVVYNNWLVILKRDSRPLLNYIERNFPKESSKK